MRKTKLNKMIIIIKMLFKKKKKKKKKEINQTDQRKINGIIIRMIKQNFPSEKN